ncbi:MAG: TetR/AcrR family transcriptional regulator [Actinobacteria bacterium]|nr:TetR/AcrR family transcriptional regulator C-terminal domain-containing protein [Actinomycetota bacterium]MCB8997569.1 TetR/AcrR family transcriptional regulator [Actinomycetota bacterium]MCB9414844.1 TetR/AcrR family transcriptional regulator [Actinomycetota bacterium]MCB9423802.1 TetR/AcrR family transcriptional regulator [Actinomycetota bacterium]HRY09476.1 TetR/AcrR family transcriptional regulator [Candidatus Nanopelagicales bacterium]
MAKRSPLTRARILAAATAVADAKGLSALTMRALADDLGTAPMAVYHHLAGKEEILDGLVEKIFEEIDDPVPGGPWREEITRRCTSARAVLHEHPWAVSVMESRVSPGPNNLRHHDAVIGTFRRAGFSVTLTAHAYALIDSYVYGFAVQEAMLPVDGGGIGELASDIMGTLPADEYPHFAELVVEHVVRPGYDFGDEFDFGLNLVLDGLEAALDRQGLSPGMTKGREVSHPAP